MTFIKKKLGDSIHDPLFFDMVANNTNFIVSKGVCYVGYGYCFSGVGSYCWIFRFFWRRNYLDSNCSSSVFHLYSFVYYIIDCTRIWWKMPTNRII